jgi:hypothetical protein
MSEEEKAREAAQNDLLQWEICFIVGGLIAFTLLFCVFGW